MSEFKTGDVVRLISGSPRMTVEGVCDDEVACVWFVHDIGRGDIWSGPVRDRFRASLLVSVERPLVVLVRGTDDDSPRKRQERAAEIVKKGVEP